MARESSRACFRRELFVLVISDKRRSKTLSAKSYEHGWTEGAWSHLPLVQVLAGHAGASASADAPVIWLLSKPEGCRAIRHTFGRARPGSPPYVSWFRRDQMSANSLFERKDFFPEFSGAANLKVRTNSETRCLSRPWLKTSECGSELASDAHPPGAIAHE